MNRDPDSSDYNDTNLGAGFVYDTPEEKEIERLRAALAAERAARQALEVAWQQMREERQAFSDAAVAAERALAEARRLLDRWASWLEHQTDYTGSEYHSMGQRLVDDTRTARGERDAG